MERVADCILHNKRVFFANGPTLKTSGPDGYKLYVSGRCRANKTVLLGGLGCFGAGRLWADEDEKNTQLPGFQDAPEVGPQELDLFKLNREAEKRLLDKYLLELN